MRAAADALRNGDSETALSRLDAEVGEDPEQSEDEEMSEADATIDEEEEEEEDMEEDVEVSPP